MLLTTKYGGNKDEINKENKTYTMLQSIGRMTQSLVHKLVGQDARQDKHPIDTSTPAFTVVITSGRLKGKTPAGALLEDADTNKKLLENQARLH